MKKILLSICLISLINFSFAQKSKKGLNISLKSGITFANMYGDGVESNTFLNGSNPDNFYANNPASDVFKNGFNAGLLLDYRFGKYFSLGLGVSYLQKGAKINALKHWNHNTQQYENVGDKIYWCQNFWTLEFPLTIYIPLKKNDIYFQAGLFSGFLLRSEERGSVNMSGNNYKYTNDRYANEEEPGYFLSAGYIYSLPERYGSVFAELSWSKSIMLSAGREMIPDPEYYYNQTISISLGYRYTLFRHK